MGGAGYIVFMRMVGGC